MPKKPVFHRSRQTTSRVVFQNSQQAALWHRSNHTWYQWGFGELALLKHDAHDGNAITLPDPETGECHPPETVDWYEVRRADDGSPALHPHRATVGPVILLIEYFDDPNLTAEIEDLDASDRLVFAREAARTLGWMETTTLAGAPAFLRPTSISVNGRAA